MKGHIPESSDIDLNTKIKYIPLTEFHINTISFFFNMFFDDISYL